MQNKFIVILFLFLLFTLYPLPRTLADEGQNEVLIYGATPAGIMAAVALKQAGVSALILEAGSHIGGIMTSGLGASDQCHPRFVGGLARDFFRKVGKHYKKPILWRFEPHVGQAIFDQYISENNIQIITGARITNAHAQNNQITKVTIENGQTYSAKVFIDASYEGDLMKLAGVSYVIGRESRAEFKEASAGVIKAIDRHQFPVPVSPYETNGKLLPGITQSFESYGSGDDKTMAYNFRLCVTAKAGNKAQIPEPTNYNPLQYELLARWLKKRPNTLLKDIVLFLDVPNEKYDLNNTGPFSTDFIGGNWDYPEANTKRRKEIIEEHAEYTKGLFYFLMNDPRVPERLRNTTKNLGLCKDEFVENNNWPPLLYVRVARRMRGEYVLTENDMDSSVIQADAVALAVCPIESHSVQRTVLNDIVFNEGWAAKRVSPYQIPYRSLVPKKGEIHNLIVPVAVSASHIAYSSLRMEPVFMTLGEVAGISASLVLAKGKPVVVQDIEPSLLHEKMYARKLRIYPPGRSKRTG